MGFCNECRIYVADGRLQCSLGHAVEDTPTFLPRPAFTPAQAGSAREGALALDESRDPRPASAAAPAPPAMELLSEPPRRGAAARTVLVVVIVAAAVAGGIGTLLRQGSTRDDGRLVRHFRAGESHPYRLSGSTNAVVTGNGLRRQQTLWIRAQGAEKTLSIDSGGVAHLRYTVDRVEAKQDGKALKLPTPRDLGVELQLAPAGAMMEKPVTFGDQTFGGRLEPNWMSPEDFVPFFGETPVRPGATWTSTAKDEVPLLARETLITRRYKYLAGEPSAKTYSLQATSTTPIKLDLTKAEIKQISGQDAGPLTAQYTASVTDVTNYTILRSTGRVIRADGRAKGTINIVFTALRSVGMTISVDVHFIYES